MTSTRHRDKYSSGSSFGIKMVTSPFDWAGRIVIALGEESFGESTGASEREGDYVVLSIKDNGVGMDEATRGKLFNTFFTTKGQKGTGLGLAIVHQVVAHAGGFVDVDSKLGIGTIGDDW